MKIYIEDEVLGAGEYYVPRSLHKKISESDLFKDFAGVLKDIMKAYEDVERVAAAFQSDPDNTGPSIQQAARSAQAAFKSGQKLPNELTDHIEGRMPFHGYMALIKRQAREFKPGMRYQGLIALRSEWQKLHKGNAFVKQKKSAWQIMDNATNAMNFLMAVMNITDTAANWIMRRLGINLIQSSIITAGDAPDPEEEMVLSADKIGKLSESTAKKLTQFSKRDLTRLDNTIQMLIKLQHHMVSAAKLQMRGKFDEGDLEVLQDHARDTHQMLMKLPKPFLVEFPYDAYQSIKDYLELLMRIKFSSFDAEVQSQYIDVILRDCHYVDKTKTGRYMSVGIKLAFSIVMFGMSFTRGNIGTAAKAMNWLNLIQLLLTLVETGMNNLSSLRMMKDRIYNKMASMLRRQPVVANIIDDEDDPAIMTEEEIEASSKKRFDKQVLLLAIAPYEQMELMADLLEFMKEKRIKHEGFLLMVKGLNEDIMDSLASMPVEQKAYGRVKKLKKLNRKIRDKADKGDYDALFKAVFGIRKQLDKDVTFATDPVAFTVPVREESITACMGDDEITAAWTLARKYDNAKKNARRMLTGHKEYDSGYVVWQQVEKEREKKRLKKKFIRMALIAAFLFLTAAYAISRKDRAPMANFLYHGMTIAFRIGKVTWKFFSRGALEVGSRVLWPVTRTVAKVPKSVFKLLKWGWGSKSYRAG